MADQDAALKQLDVGSYAEIAKRPNPHRLEIQPVPALAALLLSAEKEKGSALTENEVEALRDNATVVVVDLEAAEAVDQSRGYKDINPSSVWEEWQFLRREFQ